MGTKTLGSTRNDYLKLIAMVTMLIDHIGYIFFPRIILFRTIGRIAFPIYAYSIAAGYKFSSNRLNYALRLFWFAIISYAPYIYFNPLLEPSYFRFNVLFLLLAGLGAITLWDKAVSRLKSNGKASKQNRAISGWYLMISFVIFMFLPNIIDTILSIIGVNFGFSYGTYGLFLIMIFYWFYDKPIVGIVVFCVLSFFDGLAASFIVNGSDIWGNDSLFGNITDIAHFIQMQGLKILSNDLLVMEGFFFQFRAIIGVVLVYLLKPINARLNLNKYFFYWFYPVHIVVILLIYGSLVK